MSNIYRRHTPFSRPKNVGTSRSCDSDPEVRRASQQIEKTRNGKTSRQERERETTDQRYVRHDEDDEGAVPAEAGAQGLRREGAGRQGQHQNASVRWPPRVPALGTTALRPPAAPLCRPLAPPPWSPRPLRRALARPAAPRTCWAVPRPLFSTATGSSGAGTSSSRASGDHPGSARRWKEAHLRHQQLHQVPRGVPQEVLSLGLEISAEEIYSSSYAAAAYLKANNFPTDGSRRCTSSARSGSWRS